MWLTAITTAHPVASLSLWNVDGASTGTPKLRTHVPPVPPKPVGAVCTIPPASRALYIHLGLSEGKAMWWVRAEVESLARLTSSGAPW